jgi:hypothetical protein
LGVTLDNASNNETFIKALSRSPDITFSENNRFRCFAHVLNLAVQAFLDPQKDLIKKVRNILSTLKYSPIKLGKLKNLCESLSIKFVKPKLDVTTRWNSTWDMLTRAICLEKPLNMINAELTDSKGKQNMQDIIIDWNEWERLKEITKFLERRQPCFLVMTSIRHFLQ